MCWCDDDDDDDVVVDAHDNDDGDAHDDDDYVHDDNGDDDESLQIEYLVEDTASNTSTADRKESSSEHGLTCCSWNDCPFESDKIAVGVWDTRHRMRWDDTRSDNVRQHRSIHPHSFFLSSCIGGYSKVARVLSLNGSTMREVRILCHDDFDANP